MVDSRDKGTRAEMLLKKLLRDKTGLNFQRTPSSGALNETHKLKGDIYLPNSRNKYCIEVKHYKDDHLTSKILSNKNPQLIEWWEQAFRQAEQVEMIPLLFFKFDRSKWFMATMDLYIDTNRSVDIFFEDYFFTIYNVDDVTLGDIEWTL